MSERAKMTFVSALDVLIRAHTQDDDRVGFIVMARPMVEAVSLQDYMEAWEEIRRAMGRPYNTPTPPTKEVDHE